MGESKAALDLLKLRSQFIVFFLRTADHLLQLGDSPADFIQPPFGFVVAQLYVQFLILLPQLLIMLRFRFKTLLNSEQLFRFRRFLFPQMRQLLLHHLQVGAVNQIGVHLLALSVLLTLRKASRNRLQRRFSALQFSGGSFEILVIADVRLHRRNVDSLFAFADKLRDELLNIVVGIESNRLFQEVFEFCAKSAQKPVNILTVARARIKKAGILHVILLEIFPQLRNFHRYARFDKMIAGDLPDISEKAPCSVAR